ncbi:TAP-like protein-domain-containing protein [Mycena haematopus]|nr:TAP-like protein-domain-containing protein [Mycena haematopus]
MAAMRRLLASCLPFVALWIFFSTESPYAKYRLQGKTHQPERGVNILPTAHRVYDDFSWESISPTEELIWTACYSNQHCARLKVPLDYAHPDGASATIAMITPGVYETLRQASRRPFLVGQACAANYRLTSCFDGHCSYDIPANMGYPRGAAPPNPPPNPPHRRINRNLPVVLAAPVRMLLPGEVVEPSVAPSAASVEPSTKPSAPPSAPPSVPPRRPFLHFLPLIITTPFTPIRPPPPCPGSCPRRLWIQRALSSLRPSSILSSDLLGVPSAVVAPTSGQRWFPWQEASLHETVTHLPLSPCLTICAFLARRACTPSAQPSAQPIQIRRRLFGAIGACGSTTGTRGDQPVLNFLRVPGPTNLRTLRAALRTTHSDSQEVGSPGGDDTNPVDCGSGVDLIASRGSLLSTIVGPEFDIIGFDPRGVGHSIPRISFFSSRAERQIWFVDDAKIGSMNSSADAPAHAWARGTLVGQLAGEQDDGSLRFMNTDHTARDMLRIVEAHGREKLQYWGFSYGSVLGATFAAMFPQKVGRLVIDGVVDSEDYFAAKWHTSLIDADKVWMAFIHGCVAAGPSGCPLFAPTTAELHEKVDQIYASVRARPIPVRTNTSFGLVDWTMVRSAIFTSLYTPYATFPTLARALADLSEGNGTAMFKLSEQPAFECGCDPSQYLFEHLREAAFGILCNDGKRLSPEYEDVVAHYRDSSQTSSWADVWEPLRMPCLAWPQFPKDHFQGPFVANTSFPLLLVGNTADPVTPLWAAKKMSQGFAGSVVLTQDSPGHCSIAAVSICTLKHIRQYFLEGMLPVPGTVCPVDVLLFPSPDFDADDEVQANFVLDAADRNLFEAARELAKMPLMRFPMGI